MPIPEGLFATKSVDSLRAEAEQSHGLKRALTGLDLVTLGIGAIIGTGIFVLTGRAAAANAGPAVALSFGIAAVASTFAGLCYSEMASMIPIAGSAYTYSYATMGELVAWIIGWDLILEYLVSAAAVSVGWSGYVVAFMHDAFGVDLPHAWTSAPVLWREGHFEATGAIVNLPAMLIILAVTAMLIRGVKESARVNTVIVIVKVIIVLLFIVFAAPYVHTQNWHPFVPPNEGPFGRFGVSGVFQGATMVFFSYIGFDAVSTAAQEAKNPQRDLPIGILGSLGICTVLYIAVSLILTGVVSYKKLSVPHPIALGVEATGQLWLATAVEIGAIAGLSSVMLVMLLGQPRIFFAMANDGLIPAVAAKIHPRFGTPYITTIVTGLLCAAGGGVLPIEILAELTSIGTLFAFVLVSLGVMILRIRRPDLPRAFKAPGGPYLVPILGMLTSGVLMYTATTATIIRLFVWMAIGLVIYFAYGRRHSKLRLRGRSPGLERLGDA
ncbi:MAG TPA: amino acid permease [Polyangiaceae bacterium]|jgi:APA family basic amino acid/polyamine antiporter|nr:amino acid permease [Polyangiaceae bacterium]